MLKLMIEHYTPLITSIKTMLGYKTTHLLGASIATSISIESISLFLNKDFLGVPIVLTLVACLFIVIDWFLGTAASNKLAKIAKEEGDLLTYSKKKFKSTKIGHTAFKFISLYLWLLLSFVTNKKMVGIPYIEPLFNIIAIVPVLLFTFREYISIGEDIFILTGKKFYLFTIAEKIFQIFEFKFFKSLKND